MIERFVEEFAPQLITIVVILTVAVIALRISRRLLNTMIEHELKEEEPDTTQLKFLKNSLQFIIYTIAIILVINTIPPLKRLGTALFAGAGILAAIIGFASQQAFSNIIGGIFIILFKPFSVGDTIETNGHTGKVTNITLRHVVIKDLENRRIIVPNSKMSTEKIINSTIHDEKICKHINFSISYNSDIDKAMQIIAEEVQKHPNFLDNRSMTDVEDNSPAVKVKVVALADSSVDLRAFAWSHSNPMSRELQWDVLKSVKERFDSEGIEIPYPHRTIVQG